MKKRIGHILILLLPIFIMGCRNNDSKVEQSYSVQHISFLRSANPKLTTEEAKEYPVYYTIDVENDEISVLNSIGNDFTSYELQDFSESRETVEFTYNFQTVILKKKTDNTYTDEFDNRYQIIKK